jgi:flagellar basal-body rod protein FlgB
MNVRNLDVISIAEAGMRFSDRRQEVLASNMANANTPGYRALETKSFGEVLRGASSSSISTVLTNFMHIPGSRSSALSAFEDENAVEQKQDGNTVSLDHQAMLVADNDQAHSLATNLHRKYTAMYRSALGR